MEPLDTRYVASDPAQYEKFMGRWSELLAKPFLRFAGIKSGDQVLDVGCGTGVTTEALAEAIRAMRFPDRSFDACVSTLVLDLIPDVEQRKDQLLEVCPIVRV